MVNPKRHVKPFRNGRNRAVRIPREFELPGDEAIMRKESVQLIVEPAPPGAERLLSGFHSSASIWGWSSRAPPLYWALCRSA